ncbi:MAG: ROK family protein [Prevotella sp.]|nr:ROK family protein [Prevotella sp.]
MEETIFKTRVVGVDISIERTTCAIVNIRGDILAECDFDTRDYPDLNDFVTALGDHILTLVEENGGYETVRSVGISGPGANSLTGVILNPSNLPWKGTVPLATLLRDRIGLAVGMSNDCHVSALGEREFGSAHGMKDFIVVSLGVGVGSCFFSNGHEHKGFEGFAGEFGHICVAPQSEGRLCGCGQRGCLEAYAGANGIVLTAQELMAERPDTPSLMRDEKELTAKFIAECCDKGDELAIETYRRTGGYLGYGLATYSTLINPQAIILTGGVSRAGKWLMEPLQESFEQHVLHNLKGRVKIVRSILSDRERDVLGASVLAWDIPEYSLFK